MTMRVTVGQFYRFDYPDEFVTLPDYSAHRGQRVRIVREAIDGTEYDCQGDSPDDLMYWVEAEDGWMGLASTDELGALMEEEARS